MSEINKLPPGLSTHTASEKVPGLSKPWQKLSIKSTLSIDASSKLVASKLSCKKIAFPIYVVY